MNSLLALMIKNEMKNQKIKNYVLSDHVDFDVSKLKVEADTYIFVYSQSHYFSSSFFVKEFTTTIESAMRKFTINFNALENGKYDRIMLFRSSINISYDTSGVKNIIKYVKVKPIPNTNE